MEYTNPAFPPDEPVPTIGVIRKAFDGFTEVNSGDLWYETDYLKDETPKRIIQNIYNNLRDVQCDPMCLQSSKAIMRMIKTHKSGQPEDRIEAFFFFSELLIDFYKLCFCSMDVVWPTIDEKHAYVIHLLFKWKGISQNLPTPYDFFEINDLEFLVVTDVENAGIESDECSKLRDMYKTSRQEFIDEFQRISGVRIDNLVKFLDSAIPMEPWMVPYIDQMIKDRVGHMEKCTEYTGNRRFITKQLKIVIDQLCKALGQAEEYLMHAKGFVPFGKVA